MKKLFLIFMLLLLAGCDVQENFDKNTRQAEDEIIQKTPDVHTCSIYENGRPINERITTLDDCQSYLNGFISSKAYAMTEIWANECLIDYGKNYCKSLGLNFLGKRDTIFYDSQRFMLERELPWNISKFYCDGFSRINGANIFYYAAEEIQKCTNYEIVTNNYHKNVDNLQLNYTYKEEKR